jgi:hypothetical protein
MKEQKQTFILPDHYLKMIDYFRIAYNGYQMWKRRIERAEINGVDIACIFNEVLREKGFDPSLSILNMGSLMLKRFREMGFQIDTFCYAFECNPPEKPFVIRCREFFPNSKIIGYQHTTFFRNQLAYHMSPDEEGQHPLPEEIVCSGPRYVELHEEAGFPSEILTAGPNLRFESVHGREIGQRVIRTGKKKKVMLALTYSHDLAFELFDKVVEALNGRRDYSVYVRSHPLLSRHTLIGFLRKIGITDYEFADEGEIQDWLPELYAFISAGASITILEAVTMGTPVIRVIPNNTFFYDPFGYEEYPLEPVNNSWEISRQLQAIDRLLDDDAEVFVKIAKKVLPKYFTKPNEENMTVFL